MESPCAMYCMIHMHCIVQCIVWTLLIIVNSNILRHVHVLFRHIQPYCGILEPYVTLVYWEYYHIQNLGIIRTQDIFRTRWRRILEYLEYCVTPAYWKTLPYSELWHILAYLGPKAYLESCLIRHIQAYSGIFNNDSYNNINFHFSL